MSRAAEIFLKAFSDGVKPAPLVSVSEWANKYRMLPETSAEPGLYRTSRTPFLEEIMDELSHMSRTKEVVFMKSAQIGATEAGNNFLGYIVDYMPGTTMVVWPALPDVKKNSKLRIDPLFEDTPKLRSKINVGNSKDKNNTSVFKKFDGGALILTGANSASGLRSIPARFLFLDEIDGYPDDVEGEGDPVSLVTARTRTFPRRKIFKVSTPTVAGRSKIESAFMASDQRYYHVPCPHCKEKQKLEFENLRYETVPGAEYKYVTSASYYCCKCGEEIKEYQKTEMLANGEWIAENDVSEIAGFHINALYSPLGWMSWKQIAQDWVEAQGNFEKLIYFHNTVLGLTFEDKGDKPEHNKLYDRREDYAICTVPNGVLFLTCAVDVQKDRLEVEVHGWGRYKERWVIDRHIILGSPQDDDTWNELELYFARSFENARGLKMGIKMAAVDSGYETSKVYDFCRRFSPRKVIPIKGDQNLPQIVGMPKAVDAPGSNGKNKRRGLKLYRVGTNITKSEIYGDLKKDPPIDLLDSHPPGFIHFPELEMEYFLQLTAEERKITKNKKGYNQVSWVKKRERNETLDLHVYNRAVASILGIDKMTEAHYLKLESNIGLVTKLEKKDTKKENARIKKRNRRNREDAWL